MDTKIQELGEKLLDKDKILLTARLLNTWKYHILGEDKLVFSPFGYKTLQEYADDPIAIDSGSNVVDILDIPEREHYISEYNKMIEINNRYKYYSKYNLVHSTGYLWANHLFIPKHLFAFNILSKEENDQYRKYDFKSNHNTRYSINDIDRKMDLSLILNFKDNVNSRYTLGLLKLLNIPSFESFSWDIIQNQIQTDINEISDQVDSYLTRVRKFTNSNYTLDNNNYPYRSSLVMTTDVRERDKYRFFGEGFNYIVNPLHPYNDSNIGIYYNKRNALDLDIEYTISNIFYNRYDQTTISKDKLVNISMDDLKDFILTAGPALEYGIDSKAYYTSDVLHGFSDVDNITVDHVEYDKFSEYDVKKVYKLAKDRLREIVDSRNTPENGGAEG